MLDQDIRRFLVISFLSGILKGNKEDILPPPPPFPKFKLDDFEKDEKTELKKGKLRKSEETKEISKIKNKKKVEEIDGLKELDMIGKKGNPKKKKSNEQRTKKTFEFFHKLGFVKTDQEKKEVHVRRQQAKSYKEKMRRSRFEQRVKARKAIDISKLKKPEKEKPKKDNVFKGFESKISKPVMKKDIQIGKELKELETPKFKKPKIKPREPQLISRKEKVTKPEEVKKAENEIQRAIKGVKSFKEKKSIFKKLFIPKKRKPKNKDIEEALPIESMPIKANEVDEVLNKVHKARNALMEFDLKKAKSNYIEIMKIYYNLSVENKKKVYQDIKDLYKERKNAESLK